MARHIAHAEWTREPGEVSGEVSVAGERLALASTQASSREGTGTNPEELLAAAHAASFAIALQTSFSGAAHRAQAIRVRAELHLDRRDGRATITRSDLEGEIALEQDSRKRDMPRSEFQAIVEDAAANCPVSRALANVEITVDARPVTPRRKADSSPTDPRAVDPRDQGEGRSRRALEGQLVSRIRSQARRRHPLDGAAIGAADRPETVAGHHVHDEQLGAWGLR
jgi:osmotically inducible protein OsmC